MSEQEAPAEVAASPDTSAKKAKGGQEAAQRRSRGGAGKTAKKAAATRKAAVSRPQAGKPKGKGSTGAVEARTDTKQAKLIAMLRASGGATIEEVVKAFGWLPHTARGAIYGALKKKLNLKVESEKVEGRGRVYRIAD